MRPEFDLIIFDCDGVLVDSERIANAVFAKVLEEECGLRLSLEQMFDTFVGHSKAQCLQIVENMIGASPPPVLSHRYQQDIDQALRDSVVAVNGVESVLQTIDIPYCVASSGSHQKMTTTLGKTGLHNISIVIFLVPQMLREESQTLIFTCMRLIRWG